MGVCPDKMEWETKAKDTCPNPDEYHCMYDTECNLVEDCRPKQTNNEIALYFIGNDTIFNTKIVPVMSSNNPDYHKLQQVTFCKRKSTPSNNGWKTCCITSVALCIFTIALSVFIYCIIFRRRSKELKKENNDFEEKTFQLKNMNGEKNNTQSRFAQESSPVGQTVQCLVEEDVKSSEDLWG